MSVYKYLRNGGRSKRQEREKLYQPFVLAENVRLLYRLKLTTGEPMTVLINRAIQEYDKAHGRQGVEA